MVEFILAARFTGEEAQRSRIPAYEGAQTLQGLSRAMTLVGHYTSTLEVRKRAPFSRDVGFFMEPPRRGSFDALFTVFVQNPEALAIGGGVASGIVANLLTDALKTVFGRVTGRDTNPTEPALQEAVNQHPGDFEALVDAAEPALVRGHTVIGQGATNVTIIKGDNNVINFNQNTKGYVQHSDFSDEDEYSDVSIGSFNVNTHYGRAFFPELGKTVPFTIDKAAVPGTAGVLSTSLQKYAEGHPSHVSIRYRKVTAADGRIKKIVIYAASPAQDDV